MSTIDVELLHDYQTECAEHLAILEKSVLTLNVSGTKMDQALGTRLVRSAHALRVGAAALGLEEIAELAQRTEKALAALRNHRVAPEPDRVTLLLRAIEMLRKLIGHPEAGKGAEFSETADALAVLAIRSTPAEHQRGPVPRLRTLLVEDDFTSRLLLQTFLARYGDCHVAVNGKEAIEAFRAALEGRQAYDLICMDIMMPEMDGSEAIRQIRAMEEERGILSTEGTKIIMTTCVSDFRNVARSFWDLCDAYLVKPIDLAQLLATMRSYDLVA